MALTLAKIAELVGGQVLDGPGAEISGVSSIADATDSELGFLSDGRYLSEADQSAAAAFLISEHLASSWDTQRPRVVVPDARVALRVLLSVLHPEEAPAALVHPTAVIAESAEISPDVDVGPYAVVEAGAKIGEGSRIGAHSVVGRNVVVGSGCLIHPHVVLYADVVLGRGVIIHAGAKIGVDGFGYVLEGGRHEKIPQVGSCHLGDGVEIGANSCIDRGSIGRTVIGDGVKVDNQVHIAHNVHVGEHSLLIAQVGIAGSTRVGRGVVFAGQSAAVGHVRVGDGATVGGRSVVTSDIEPGAVVLGFPARDRAQTLRAYAASFKVDDLIKKVRRLARRVAALEETEGPAAPGDEG